MKLYNEGNLIFAGCDEAGRGCLAGPVVASAVILPTNFHHPLLDDSKVLSEKTRNILYPIIKTEALAWAVGICSHDEIDKINILQASILSMHKALDKLKHPFNKIIVDGNKFKPYKNIQYDCIVDGDAKFAQIAAASIIAKVDRDAIMKALHIEFPYYGWNKNMGYPTKIHLEGLRKYGVSVYHRKSYKPVSEIIHSLFN